MSIGLHFRFLLGFLIASAGAAGAFAQPLYPADDTPPYPVPAGTFHRMSRDWNGADTLVSSKPDHSYHSIWVRLFPLVSLPLGDPYPDTQNYNFFAVSNTGGFALYSLTTEALLATGKAVEFDYAAGTVTIDKSRTLPLEPLWLNPAGTALSEVNWDKNQKLPTGKSAEVRARMRGGFVVKKSIHQPKDQPVARELWSVINVVAVNDYIQSVVPSEVIASWHRETLRAQAIAARTYGLWEVAMARLNAQDFDVDPSTWFQSYQGAQFWDRETAKWHDVELAATSDAVRSTGGEVVTYKDEVIKAFFSSNSGGRTCTVAECLETTFNPDYIVEMNDHPNIRSAPGGTWGTRATLTPSEIRRVLLSVGVDPGKPVYKLEALEKGPSGRTWRLRVVLNDSSTMDLDRLQTRKIMHLYGPIRSFMYDLLTVGSDGKQAIKGYGYGHAVGMSQWGAQLYAKGGWNAHKILEYYYHGVVIKDLGFTAF